MTNLFKKSQRVKRRIIDSSDFEEAEMEVVQEFLFMNQRIFLGLQEK